MVVMSVNSFQIRSSLKRSFSIVFVVILFVIQAKAQISGTSHSWKHMPVRLSVLEDPITHTYQTLSVDSIDADGHFNLPFDTKETKVGWVSVNRFKAPIYMAPKHQYQIVHDHRKEDILVNTWQRGTFNYRFVDLPDAELNAEILAFDSDYYAFITENSAFIGHTKFKTGIKEFEKVHSQSEGSEYFEHYKKYSIAELKLTGGFSRKDVYDTYLKDQPIRYKDEVWYKFFDLFYADYFEFYPNQFGGETMPNRFRKGLAPYSVDTLLLKDDFLQNPELRQLVMLKSAYESFTKKDYPKKPLLDLVNYVVETTKMKYIENAGKKVLEKMNFDPNTLTLFEFGAPYLPEILDLDTAKYTVLFIGDSEQKETQKEKLILESLLKKYPEYFQVVELDIADPLPGFPWYTFQITDVRSYLDQWHIFGIPKFVWCSPTGKILDMELERPSQGLEKRLHAMKTKREELQKIKIGQ